MRRRTTLQVAAASLIMLLPIGGDMKSADSPSILALLNQIAWLSAKALFSPERVPILQLGGLIAFVMILAHVLGPPAPPRRR